MNRDRTAFTMLELMISLTIIGIVSAAAIPIVHASIRGQRIEAASRQFIAELQHCRSIAINENRRIRFTPTTNSLAYQLQRYTASGTLASTTTVNLSTTAQTPVIIDTFSAPPNTYLEINHRGEISAPSGDVSGLTAGSIARVVFRSGGVTKTVQISPSFTALP